MDEKASLSISADLYRLDLIRRFVEEKAAALEADPEAISAVVQAVDEAATNIIVHGYQKEPGIIEIEIWGEGDAFVVRLRDQAPPFDPTTLPEPDLSLSLEERPFGGLGVFLIKQFMDEMRYRVTPQGGNELTLVKKSILPSVSEEESNEYNC